MGYFEKGRCKRFYTFCENYNPNDPNTTEGFDAREHTIADLFKKFSLDTNTTDFIGHAVCLYTNDNYMHDPAISLIERMNQYEGSANGPFSSPFVYPRFGSKEIIDGFLKLSAENGSKCMLNTNVDEIIMKDGKAVGIKIGTEIIESPVIIADPTYVVNMPKYVKKGKRIIRCVCVLNHPIANTGGVSSCHIVIPQKQIKHKSDIYITLTSNQHLCCPNGFYIATISTYIETDNPEAEIEPALWLLKPIEEIFTSV